MSIFNETENERSNAPMDDSEVAETIRIVKSGANWFYWIAALSLINSFILIGGGSVNFIVGLAFTQFIDGFMIAASGQNDFNAFRVLALVLNILIAGIFAMFGFFGGKGIVLAFIAGTVLYVLDALLYLFFGDLLAAGFHAFALIFIIRGLLSAVKLKAAIKNAPMVQS